MQQNTATVRSFCHPRTASLSLQGWQSWKHPFARQKHALQAERSLLDDPSKDQETLDNVNAFFSNEALQAALTTIKRKKKHFTLDNLSIMRTYLFCSLVYRNWQRPGAVISLTIEEAAGAVEKDGHLVLHSRQHKTTLAMVQPL